MPTLRNLTDSDAEALIPGLPPQVIPPGGSVDVPDDVFDAANWPGEVWDGGAEPTVIPEEVPEPVNDEAPAPRKRAARK